MPRVRTTNTPNPDAPPIEVLPPAAADGEAAPRPRRRPADTRMIHVRGAKEHNLKNLSVSIPRD